LILIAAAGLAVPAATSTAAASSPHAVDGGAQAAAARVCPAPPVGYAACDALRNDAANPDATVPSASGLTPADIQSAYKLPGTAAGAGHTVAVVDTYDDPTAEADLAVFRAQYGLPECTSANGCFRKVNQSGGSAMPRKDAGWAQEISLDLDMVSATCPSCRILLVEASSASFGNLGAAVNYAASQKVDAISNSYGGSDASDASYGHYYDHPGTAITVSSGDNGYGVEYPASSQFVTAVGGTSLRRDGSVRGWVENAWSGAGSGCSAYNTKPGWQTNAGCAKRTVADVSAVADPATGVNVYDSTAYQGRSGWLVFGGTSASAPIIASVYALAGNASAVTYGSYPYSHASALFDVTSGSNGSCGGSYLCTATAGFDGPTGLGTPNGVGAV
jgi:subtilase family serine protease